MYKFVIINEYRLTYRGEAPTTVESPFEDVTRGVLNAIIEIEELSNNSVISDIGFLYFLLGSHNPLVCLL